MEILVDTREKKPFEFLFSKATVTSKALKTGDYSIFGCENEVTIDRKASTGELSMCFGSEWKRFSRELERMKTFKSAHILCSFPYEYIDSFPEMSTIPKYRWRYLRIRPAFLRKRIFDIEDEYGVKFHFCEDRAAAELKAYEILKEYNDSK